MWWPAPQDAFAPRAQPRRSTGRSQLRKQRSERCLPLQGRLQSRLGLGQNDVTALAEAGRLAHVDPLAEDQVRPGWLGDVAQQGSARELGERVFFFEAVTVPLSGLHRDVLFLDADLIGHLPEGMKIARAGVGGIVQ